MSVSQANENGAVVSLALSAPSTKNSTSVTIPESSLALAETVTVPLTTAPAAGAVIETAGGVRSVAPPAGNRVYKSRFGEPVPADPTTPAVACATTACATVAAEAPGFVCR